MSLFLVVIGSCAVLCAAAYALVARQVTAYRIGAELLRQIGNDGAALISDPECPQAVLERVRTSVGEAIIAWPSRLRPGRVPARPSTDVARDVGIPYADRTLAIAIAIAEFSALWPRKRSSESLAEAASAVQAIQTKEVATPSVRSSLEYGLKAQRSILDEAAVADWKFALPVGVFAILFVLSGLPLFPKLLAWISLRTPF